MYKKACLLILSVFALSVIRAQDYARPSTNDNPIPQNKKFCLTFVLGSSIPEGNFASTSVKNTFWDFNSVDSTHLEGFAKPGLHFSFTATYLFSQNFGLMVYFGSNSNAFNVNGLAAAVGIPAFSSTLTYHTHEYLIGPYCSFPFNYKSKFRFDAFALYGFVSNDYPTVSLALNDTVTDAISFQSGHGTGFCLGTGIEYKLNDNTSLLFNLQYTGARISYNGFTETVNIASPNPAYYYLPYSIDHPNDVATMQTGILKIAFGIAFWF